MKKLNLHFIVLVLALFVLLSCKKENLNEYPDFVGTWYASDIEANYEIVIKNNGRGTYEKKSKNSEIFARGRFRLYKDELKIGIKKFEVNVYPHKHFAMGLWTMTLDGIQYYSTKF